MAQYLSLVIEDGEQATYQRSCSLSRMPLSMTRQVDPSALQTADEFSAEHKQGFNIQLAWWNCMNQKMGMSLVYW